MTIDESLRTLLGKAIHSSILTVRQEMVLVYVGPSFQPAEYTGGAPHTELKIVHGSWSSYEIDSMFGELDVRLVKRCSQYNHADTAYITKSTYIVIDATIFENRLAEKVRQEYERHFTEQLENELVDDKN